MPFPTSSMPGELLPGQQIGTQGLQTVFTFDEALWHITRFWPPVDIHIPAFSTEPHIVSVVGTLPDNSTLGLADLTETGFEIAFHNGSGPLTWTPLEPDEERNAIAEATGGAAFYFRLLLGPDADVALAPGPYYVMVRTATSPHVARNLPLLIVEPPYPS